MLFVVVYSLESNLFNNLPVENTKYLGFWLILPVLVERYNGGH